MRITILRTTRATLAITTWLSAPTMAQELRMAIWSANDAHLALFNAIADDYEPPIPASASPMTHWPSTAM